MQNKLAKILFSTRLTAILFLVFAGAMAIGTFMDAGEATSPTPYSRNLIYNTWWFEAIMVFFMINFIGNIKRYRLHKREKWASLILHLAFIFILLGAFITRYVGFEGMMAIREGATENTFLSQKTYITTYIDGDYMIDGVPQRLPLEREVDFSPRLNNTFKIETKYDQQPVTIELVDFIGGAEEDIIPDEEGESYLKLVEAGGGKPHNHFLKSGEVQSIHNILVALDKETPGAINIYDRPDGIYIHSPFEGEFMTMATMATGKLEKDSLQPLALRSRYVIGNMQLVFPKPVIKGKFGIVKKAEFLKNDEDGVLLKVTTNGETKEVGLLGGKGSNGEFKQIEVGGLDFAFKYGSKGLELPFSIKLNDFEAERYPGTEKSYSAFSSKVTVLDEEEGDFDYKIYMNHILDHRGYRFFQSGFDPDEKGTILSVNHDYYGTLFTYIGYFLLYFGLLAILFSKGTRFGDLRRMLNSVKAKKAKLLPVILLCFTVSGLAQTEQHTEDHDHSVHSKPNQQQIDSVLKANITSKDHADKFGHMVIQDLGGRMMPVNTYASELLRKLTKYDTYSDFNANQVFLSIQESPLLWYNVPVIYLKAKKADSIRHIIGVSETQKYATLADFFTDRGEYKLEPFLEEAYKAQVPNGFQKEFKETDQRVNLLYNTIEGRSLRIFPLPENENNKWISSIEYRTGNYKVQDSLYANFINSGFSAYLMTLNQAKRTGDYSDANKLLDAFHKTQMEYGSAVMLSDKKVKTEILYNKYDIFKKLFSWYMYAGTLLFIVLIVQIFNSNNKAVNLGVNVLKGIVVLLFILHTAGLIARWYISGHAPWSDAYESMIYVAWATMLFGLLFGRRSDLTIAATAFVTSMILMVAHWNWMDPAIANLQPVLDSYWLMIHVAVIVASYGPFTLGMILGLTALFLMIFTNKENKEKMGINIRELTVINEMALTVGLVMLTIGNFLGGMWANESWGRYWGWDPKETWALISIMVYAFVIHMRLVPGLRGRFGFNLASILAYSSIMMTYFGVNFYLAGLHSYASGDQIVSVKFILIALAIIAVIAAFAYSKYAKFYRKGK
ncbi:cytochrome c biogenesis protein CcsA [Formosa sp. S-31]|uniref:cytochrome c biogenesis protein n=1 Tax=Formosa sp. S-31 TaxID=2790949 RepID=UPI003EBD3DFE